MLIAERFSLDSADFSAYTISVSDNIYKNR